MIQVGTKVKPFTLCNQFNEPVSLDNFHGLKKVIYFYPKDDTQGCTVQACTFGNHYEKFKQNNWVVIGISKDSVKSHEKFVKKYNLPFILLADPDLEVINQFGVYQEKTMYGKKVMGVRRSTFVLDENDVVIKVFEDAKPDTNALDVLNFLEGTGQ